MNTINNIDTKGISYQPSFSALKIHKGSLNKYADTALQNKLFTQQFVTWMQTCAMDVNIDIRGHKALGSSKGSLNGIEIIISELPKKIGTKAKTAWNKIFKLNMGLGTRIEEGMKTLFGRDLINEHIVISNCSAHNLDCTALNIFNQIQARKEIILRRSQGVFL